MLPASSSALVAAIDLGPQFLEKRAKESTILTNLGKGWYNLLFVVYERNFVINRKYEWHTSDENVEGQDA